MIAPYAPLKPESSCNGERARFFLAEAFRLWEAGHAQAAGCLARIAIERHLRYLGVNHPKVKAANLGILGKGGKRAKFVRTWLVEAGMIDPKTANRLADLHAIGNLVAHGSLVPARKIVELLRCAHTIVTQWTIGGATCS